MKKYITPTLTVLPARLADAYLLTASPGLGDAAGGGSDEGNWKAPSRRGASLDDDDYGW